MRVHNLQRFGSDILVRMLPVMNWIERRRSAETAELVKLRLHRVLYEAVECSRLEIPEYAGGEIRPAVGTQSLSAGARRTSEMGCNGYVAFAESLVSLGRREIDAGETQRQVALDDSAMIRYLGEKAYSIGSSAPITVTYPEHAILQEFIATPSLDTEQLQTKAGNDRAPRILGQLAKKYNAIFAPAIRLPGGKGGKGGYSLSPSRTRDRKVIE